MILDDFKVLLIKFPKQQQTESKVIKNLFRMQVSFGLSAIHWSF